MYWTLKNELVISGFSLTEENEVFLWFQNTYILKMLYDL